VQFYLNNLLLILK